MHRIRSIPPQFWTSDRYSGLSDKARLLLLGANTLADDEGLLPWTPQKCRAIAFEGRGMSKARIAVLMAEIISAKLVLQYHPDYAMLVYFLREQRICRPSKTKLPIPELSNPEIQQAYFDRENGQCCVCSGAIEKAQLPESLVRIKEGSDAPSNIRIAHVACQNGQYPAFWKTRKVIQWPNSQRWLDIWKRNYGGIPPIHKWKTTCLRLESKYGDRIFEGWSLYCSETDAIYVPSAIKFAAVASAWIPEEVVPPQLTDDSQKTWKQRDEEREAMRRAFMAKERQAQDERQKNDDAGDSQGTRNQGTV